MALGPELVTNGSFTGSGTGWSFGDAGAYNNNNAIMFNSGGPPSGTLAFFQAIPSIVDGTLYRLEFDIIQIDDSEVNLHFKVGVGDAITFQTIPASGILGVEHYSYDFIASMDAGSGYTPGNGALVFDYITTLFNSTIYIDNVSLKEIFGNQYLQITTMVASNLSGNIQTINAGKNDDGTPIYFELETQQLDFGNRSHLKKISDQIVVFVKDGQDSVLQAKEDTGNYETIPNLQLDERVNIGNDVDLEGHYLTFKWSGETSDNSPMLEGFYTDDITDLGMVEK